MGKYYVELVLRILVNNANKCRQDLKSVLFKGRKHSNDLQGNSYHMTVEIG